MLKYLVWLWVWNGIVNWIGVPPENFYNLGNRLYQQGKYDKAETFYTRSFHAKPVAWQAYFNAGNAAYRQGKYEQAVTYYEIALEYRPDDEDTWHNLELARQKLPQALSLEGGGRKAWGGKSRSSSRHSSSSLSAYLAMKPDSPLSDQDMDDLLALAAERERRQQESSPRDVQPDIFNLPPQQLLEIIREQTRAGYPFRQGSSIAESRKIVDRVDW